VKETIPFIYTHEHAKYKRNIPTYFFVSKGVFLTRNGVNYKVDVNHYFASADWVQNGFSNSFTPIRIEITGNTSYPLFWEYDFIEFSTNPSQTTIFQPPLQLKCGTPFPVQTPRISTTFSAIIEESDLVNNSTFAYSLYWDIGKYRRTYFTNNTEYTEFFKDGDMFKYLITEIEEACTKVSVTSNTFGVRNSGAMQSVYELFYFGEQFPNKFYGGIHYARDIPCDVWTYHVEYENPDFSLTKYDLNWYISSSWWGIQNGYNTRLPVRREIIGNITSRSNILYSNIHTILDVFNFEPLYSIDPSIFQIRPEWECYDSDSPALNEHYFLYVKVNTNPDNFIGSAFGNALTTKLSINISNYDLMGLQRTRTGISTIVFAHLYLPKSLALYNNLTNIRSKLPITIGNFTLTSFEYTTSMNCDYCLNGKCYFGKCICTTGYGGPNCDISISSVGGQKTILIEVTFANYVPVSFIIGLIWFFIGAGIGFLL